VRVLFLTRYGRQGASSRLRTLQFLPLFAHEGIACHVLPFFEDRQLQLRYESGHHSLPNLARSYWQRIQVLSQRRAFDLVWIEKEALPFLPASFEASLLRGVPYVLDFDDAIFHNYDIHSSLWVRALLGSRTDQLMARARLVIAGNEYLASRARAAGAGWVEIVPTVVDLDRYTVERPSVSSDKNIRIVWIGSPTTVMYLQMLKKPLSALSKWFDFKLRVIGGGDFYIPRVDVEIVPWTETTEVEAIRKCQIGVMPLLDTPWEQGKCGYKLIQYMGCGLPVAASPIGANRTIVRVGENGYLPNTNSEWHDVLEMLLTDASLREQLGNAGRDRVEKEYCIQAVGLRLVELIRGAAGR